MVAVRCTAQMRPAKMVSIMGKTVGRGWASRFGKRVYVGWCAGGERTGRERQEVDMGDEGSEFLGFLGTGVGEAKKTKKREEAARQGRGCFK